MRKREHTQAELDSALATPRPLDAPALSLLDEILAQPIAAPTEPLEDIAAPIRQSLSRQEKLRRLALRMGVKSTPVRPVRSEDDETIGQWTISREGSAVIATSESGRRLRLVICGTCKQAACSLSKWIEE